MSALEQIEAAQGRDQKPEENVEILALPAMDGGTAKMIASELLQPATVVSAERVDELSSLEREIAEMHHVEPTSPALAQRVVDASVHNGGSVSDPTAGVGDTEAVLLEISPSSRGVTSAVQAGSALLGNGVLSGDASLVASEGESDALKHEDLIAVLKGIDHGVEVASAENKTGEQGKHEPAQRAPSATDSELAEGVTIEGEGQFQIMEIVDDELDEGASEREEPAAAVVSATASNVGSTAGLKSLAEATSKLTNDEIRAMVLEQIAGLDARSAERQRRRKQDIKPLQVEENTDLVSSLGADWSDDDKCGDDPNPPTGEPSATKAVPTLTVSDQLANDVVEADAASKEIVDASKGPETECNTQPKVTSIVVLQSGKSGSVETSSESTSKDTETATQIPQITGFRRTRIIKRKIIWDPDAPETQFSYAQLVRNPTKNADTTASKTPTNIQASTTPAASLTAATTTKATVATGVKREPPAKKPRPSTPKLPAVSLKEKKVTVPPNAAAAHAQQAPAAEKKVPARSATPMKAVVSGVTKTVTVANNTSPPTNTAQSTKSAVGDSAAVARGPSPAKRRSQTPVANGAGGKKKKFSELDRLMGDEGAVNMLNSLESERSRLGDDDKPHRPLMRSRAATITERVMKRDTTPTTVKVAVTTTNVATAAVSTPTTKCKRSAKPKPSSTWDYVYKQQASEDAMIIRRRSNSSYSSNASQHRLSLDGPVAPKAAASNKSGNASASSTAATTPASSTTNISASKPKGASKTASSTHDTGAEVASPGVGSGGKVTKGSFEFAKPNQKTNRRTKSPAHATNALASDMKKQAASAGGKRSARSPATVEDKEKEKASGAGKDSTPTAKEELTTLPPQPTDVVVKKAAKVAQIIFNTRRAKLDYTFTVQMMNKLVDVLDKLSKDAECNAVVMTTNAPHFCHGIDFTDLTGGSAEKRKQAAIQLATAVKNYLKTLATFPKPLIAGVNGSNSGLGVTQLPLFDIVIASDKGSYETPYAKIGQVPEGYCIWNNITKIRGTFKTKLFWLCEKLHSTESALSGLVNKLTAPSKVNEDAMLTAKKIAAMSPESYRFMKKTTIHNHLDTIVTALDEEFDAIIEQWTSSECLENFRKYLEAGHF